MLTKKLWWSIDEYTAKELKKYCRCKLWWSLMKCLFCQPNVEAGDVEVDDNVEAEELDEVDDDDDDD